MRGDIIGTGQVDVHNAIVWRDTCLLRKDHEGSGQSYSLLERRETAPVKSFKKETLFLVKLSSTPV